MTRLDPSALFVPLRRAAWNRYAAGTKTVEVRQDKRHYLGEVEVRPWSPKHVRVGRMAELSLGFTNTRELRRITRVAHVARFANAPAWAHEGLDLGALGGTFASYMATSVPFVFFEVPRP